MRLLHLYTRICLGVSWLVHWLVGHWLVGPLVPLSCWGYRSDAANLGWFTSQLPIQSLCLNATLDANDDGSKGWNRLLVTHRHDMSHWQTFSMHFKPKNCFSLKGASFLLFALVELTHQKSANGRIDPRRLKNLLLLPQKRGQG